MTTVSLFAPELSGTTGLMLKLTKSSDYSAVNGSGDTLTESVSSGWFTATVAEVWTEKLAASVVDSEGLIPRAGWLGVGSTVISDVVAELDSSVRVKLAAEQPDCNVLRTDVEYKHTQISETVDTVNVTIEEA